MLQSGHFVSSDHITPFPSHSPRTVMQLSAPSREWGTAVLVLRDWLVPLSSASSRALLAVAHGRSPLSLFYV